MKLQGRQFGTLKQEAKQAMFDFQAAAEGMCAIINKLIGLPDQKEPAKRIKRKPISDRAKVVRVVNYVAKSRQCSHRSVFVELYHNFFQATGMHPVVESAKRGFKRHIDAVEEAGRLPELLDEACKMLTV